MNRKVIVAVVVTFVATSLFWLTLVFAFGFYMLREPPFHISIEQPGVVELGETLDIELEIMNAGSEPVNFDSIDIYNSLFDGFELVGTTPEYNSHSDLLGFLSLYFDHRLSAEERLTIYISLRATEPGSHHGQLDVCTPTQKCTTIYVSIDVVNGDVRDARSGD